MDYNRIVEDVIMEHQVFPIDIMGIGDATGEFKYLHSLRESYVRTIRDVDLFYAKDRENRNILEIGSYLGAVSVSLKRLGYNISALDIPEFFQSPTLRKLYERNNIPFVGLNLKSVQLPFNSASLDAVILCEVLEHLNFNPLPVIKEIHRVLKEDGIFYLALPNHANVVNRIKLLMGRSIHNPIEDYFRQLDKKCNMIVGLHWREYTRFEIEQLLVRTGFKIDRQYYFSASEYGPISGGKQVLSFLKRILYCYPPFRPHHVVIARKTTAPALDFYFTEANF